MKSKINLPGIKGAVILVVLGFFLALMSCASHVSDDLMLVGNEKSDQAPVHFVSNASADSMHLEVKGHWDLSAYNRLAVRLVNYHLSQNVSVMVTMSDAKGGKLETTFKLSGDSVTDKTIQLPIIPPYPEIEKQLFGMRYTPYTVSGVNSNLDFSTVEELTIKLENHDRAVRLGVQYIEAKVGPKAALPGWMNLSEERFFPFIDKYGQFIHKEWPGKVHSDDELRRNLRLETAKLDSLPDLPQRDEYGGYVGQVKFPATGNFQVKKISDKWWLIDPAGNLFWMQGVVRVTPSCGITPLDGRAAYFADLPADTSRFAQFYFTRDEFLVPYYKAAGIKKTYDFSAANIYRKYGRDWKKKFTAHLKTRFKKWGINTLSAGSDRQIVKALHIPFCERLEMSSPRIAGAPSWLSTIRDPFDPAFKENLAHLVRESGIDLASPYFIGFFVDNKIAWGDSGDLARWALQSPARQAAKVKFIAWLRNKYVGIGRLNQAWDTHYSNWEQLAGSRDPVKVHSPDFAAFSDTMIIAYFKEVREVVKSFAPNKLYLGCRFIEINKSVLDIAARYTDVLTFDLFYDSLSHFRLPQGIDKPVVIGEFHFGALDRGLFHPGLNARKNQSERAKAYEAYVGSALVHPNVVGVNWHQYSDQATTGRFDGEDYQDGLTDVCDDPYTETVDKIIEVSNRMYKTRLH